MSDLSSALSAAPVGSEAKARAARTRRQGRFTTSSRSARSERVGGKLPGNLIQPPQQGKFRRGVFVQQLRHWMFAQINHVALISHQYNTLGKFYEAVFGLKLSAKGRPASAITIGDGYVGLNLIPRRDGYVEGIDHFGMVVDDVEPVLERMKRKHKNAAIVKRPSARPFAAYSGHDPDGNVFDLAQKKEDTRKEVYAEIAGGGWAQDRYFNKFAIRTPNAEECAEFYADVFELQPVNRNSAPGFHLSDGRVTLSILPW